MAKYRLCYSSKGEYESIDLELLECLNGRRTTDIEIIDEFTMSFYDEEELLNFLKKNNLIPSYVREIVLTVDKKENGITLNNKIFRGENLLFSDDKQYNNISYVYKWIMNNKDNPDIIVKICNNYIEKYKNAYSRTSGAAFILSLFQNLRTLVLRRKNNTYFSPAELDDFEKYVSDFISIEFYRVDEEKIKNKKVERKIGKDGKGLKRYRNIHDFVILMKILENKLYTKDILKNKSNIEVDDEVEEFITEDDMKKINDEILNDYDFSDSEYYQDGNDFYKPLTKKELEEALSDIKRVL